LTSARSSSMIKSWFTGFIVPFPVDAGGEELFRDVPDPFTKLNLPSPSLNDTKNPQ